MPSRKQILRSQSETRPLRLSSLNSNSNVPTAQSDDRLVRETRVTVILIFYLCTICIYIYIYIYIIYIYIYYIYYIFFPLPLFVCGYRFSTRCIRIICNLIPDFPFVKLHSKWPPV